MILVTGGMGFIGRALVKALVERGEKVRVLDNGWRHGQGHKMPNGVEFFNGDIRDSATVLQAVAGCEEVHHLAAINGTSNFYKYPGLVLDVAVKGMINVLDACKVHGVKTLMLASSSEVYQTAVVIPTPEDVPLVIPDPYNPRYSYAAGKIISEMMLLHSARNIERAIIMRPHNIYGPNMGNEHVIPRLARDPSNFTDGQQTRAFCYIDDAIDGWMIAREHGEHRQVYNLGTDHEIRVVDLAYRIVALAGFTPVVSAPAPADGGTERRCPDISKLRALGYQPKVSLEEGLSKSMEWYRAAA